MPDARRPSRLLLPLATALTGYSLALVELLAFRLDAAVFGVGYAGLVSAVAPAFGGLATAWLGARGRIGQGPAARAVVGAYAAAVAGSGCAATAIALTDSSHRFAKLDGSWTPLLIPFAAWLVTWTGASLTVAAALRAGRDRIGRLLFALGVGGALGAMSVPAAMSLGAPRALLAAGLPLAGAAFALARFGAAAEPKLTYLATLPLALAALLAGDLGSPWLKLRTDVGRRGRIGTTEWSAGGLLQIDQGKQGVVGYTVDRGPIRPFALAGRPHQRQAFELPDVAYFTGPTDGAALVIASGGVREIREALDSGQPRVDAVEPSAAVVKILAGPLEPESGNLLSDARVTLRVGDGRAQLPRLRERYQRILVLGDAAYTVAPPLLAAQRLFTVDAVRAYVARLEPNGVLLLRAPRVAWPHLVATALAVVEDLPARAAACSERRDDGSIALMIFGAKLEGPALHEVEKNCRRRGLAFDYPPPTVHAGDREGGATQQTRDVMVSAIGAGTILTDDRPWFERPGPAELWRSARASLKALPVAVPPVKPKDAEPRPSAAGLELCGAGLCLLIVLLAALAPVAIRKPPLPSRLALPLFGLATGTLLAALCDQSVGWLGGADWAWPVVVPLGLCALAGGRLVSDAVGDRGITRFLALSALIGAGVLGMLAVAAPRLGDLALGPVELRLGAVFVLMIIAGGLTGAPAAAALRLLARAGDPAIGWGWGAIVAGCGLGTAIAPLAARYAGVARLYLIAAVALALAAWLATVRRVEVKR